MRLPEKGTQHMLLIWVELLKSCFLSHRCFASSFFPSHEQRDANSSRAGNCGLTAIGLSTYSSLELMLWNSSLSTPMWENHLQEEWHNSMQEPGPCHWYQGASLSQKWAESSSPKCTWERESPFWTGLASHSWGTETKWHPSRFGRMVYRVVSRPVLVV